MNVHATTPAIDFAAIKQKQNAAWASGDYARIGSTLQLTGEELAERLAMTPGTRVLDVAAGNGNASLAFARRGAAVTSTDYVGPLLARGRARAEAEGLELDFEIADVENLPFTDGCFDAVVSTFGVMFAPNQDAAATELQRVTRSGGRIGLANWTPQSFVGQLFKVIGSHIAPPAGVNSPARWGDRDWIEASFGPGAAAIDFRLKHFIFRYRSAEHFLEVFRDYYGPVHKAFAALDHKGQEALAADIRALAERFNTATDGTLAAPSEYAEIVITRA